MPELINNSQRKIIEEIFRNPGIHLREIIKKTRLSPNYVSEYINLLVSRGVIKEERLGKKRAYLRRFYLDFDSTLTKNLFILVKEEEKEALFEKYQKLRPVLKQIVQENKEIDSLLVYGSYARLSAEKTSDLDLLIVGNIKNKEKIREILVSLDIEVSIKIETLRDFKERVNDSLHQQILKENILIYDSGKFIELISKLSKQIALDANLKNQEMRDF